MKQDFDTNKESVNLPVNGEYIKGATVGAVDIRSISNRATVETRQVGTGILDGTYGLWPPAVSFDCFEVSHDRSVAADSQEEYGRLDQMVRVQCGDTVITMETPLKAAAETAGGWTYQVCEGAIPQITVSRYFDRAVPEGTPEMVVQTVGLLTDAINLLPNAKKFVPAEPVVRIGDQEFNTVTGVPAETHHQQPPRIARFHRD